MPAGKNRSKSRSEWQDSTREKIQASSILNRLIKHTLAEDDVMTASQVNAAKILLNKVLPDTKEIEHKGDGVAGGVLVIEKDRSVDECLESYSMPDDSSA